MDTKTPNKFQQTFILLLLLIVLVGFIGMIQKFLIAIILAAIFSGLLYPLYRKTLYYLKDRSALAATSILIISILAIGFPLAALTSMVTSEAIQVSQKARPIVKEIMDNNISISQQLPEWLPLHEKFKSFDETIIKKASEAASSIGSWLVSSLSSATKGTVNFFISLFIMFYAMFYFLMYGRQLLDSLASLLPLSKKDYDELMSRGLMVTKASLKGIMIIGVIQGLLVGLAFWATGIGGPAFWGSVVFILSAIPGVGAPLVWLPAAAYLIFTGNMAWGIGLILWGVLVIGLVDNLLRPWIVGNDAKLPDLVILISILGGITSFGPIGIILGPVIAAILDTILNIYKKSICT
ncbi:hypothetical protein M947_01380 [Sulfurimonas hongkongensis]|uniref:Permease n=1 Tax=Sulfurimonas hongkongensis TaxID=1172190 RepID=T0JTW6_9BACT|nr:AI-2E family transporter [Sulfurimonas hongkongensis]EQB40477.1 hypothetical protein M947_01380 [Sulfurimonas hongkongensis]